MVQAGIKKYVLALLIAVMIIALDAVSKYLTFKHIPIIFESLPEFPYGGIKIFQNFFGIDFSLNKALNTGGAWSLFSSFPRSLLVIRACTICAMVYYVLKINTDQSKKIPLFLIIVGAVANLFDAFIYGAVVDLFHFRFWGYSFPIFNIADIVIFLGGTSILIQEIFFKKDRPCKRVT
tara:strand:- start:224 stop:757 length:534 start_codon:yes stop_codon:yes gene_type:complete